MHLWGPKTCVQKAPAASQTRAVESALAVAMSPPLASVAMHVTGAEWTCIAHHCKALVFCRAGLGSSLDVSAPSIAIVIHASVSMATSAQASSGRLKVQPGLGSVICGEDLLVA